MGTAPERRCGRRDRLCRGLVTAVPGATAAVAAARGRLWALVLMSSSLGYPLRRDGVGTAPERCGGYRDVSRPSRRRAWQPPRPLQGGGSGRFPPPVPPRFCRHTFIPVNTLHHTIHTHVLLPS